MNASGRRENRKFYIEDKKKKNECRSQNMNVERVNDVLFKTLNVMYVIVDLKFKKKKPPNYYSRATPCSKRKKKILL